MHKSLAIRSTITPHPDLKSFLNRKDTRRVDTLITLYAVVALGDLGIIVHIYFSDRDILLLTLRGVPELSAESVVMMGTGAK